jgi:hypothetical protein
LLASGLNYPFPLLIAGGIALGQLMVIDVQHMVTGDVGGFSQELGS